MTRKMFLTLMLTLLIAPLAAQAQTPWTGAPGAGVIDEAAAGIYLADHGTLAYNSSGSTSVIVARYDVTDTTATGNPAWTTLELRYYDPSPNSFVRAQLIRLSSGGTVSAIATCTSTDASVITVLPCSLLGATVDFNAGYIYEVVITISRSSTAVSPLFTGVRLY